MSDDEKEETSKLTVRGLPEHEKDAVRREQNRMCAQRFREKRREEYRQLCASYIASSNQVKALENRIEELVKVLQDAGIEVLPNTSNQVQENIEEDTAPNNEKLFEELMQVIENGQADTEDDDDAYLCRGLDTILDSDQRQGGGRGGGIGVLGYERFFHVGV